MNIPKRIAVTGANGFLGKHVVQALKDAGANVITLSRSDFDIHDEKPPSYDDIGRPDALIHLAWGNLSNYRDVSHFETELPAHYRFLKHLLETGLPALVAVGTCQEYGLQSGELFEDTPTQPHTSYGRAKDALRCQLQALQNNLDFALVWARLFYTYGKGQPRDSLLPQLEQAVKNEETVFNMSGGEQLRDYLLAAEIGKHLSTLALRGKNDGIVNICSSKPIAVRDLVKRWIAEKNWNITPNLGHYPYPDYEPMAFWGNNQKLQKILKDENHESAPRFQTGM